MTNPDEIKEVAIIGLGTMGAVIAQVFAQNGYRVKGYEAHDKALQTAQKVIQMNVRVLSQDENAEIKSVEEILANIQYAGSIAEAVECAD
ncbi:MAG: NAD(P)-binding domain-containing protein, partial [Deltaproteobacteria bacterium]|nr:NAD(P)-binding domain-containing protein [Deltaproteobacteria bacterium]